MSLKIPRKIKSKLLNSLERGKSVLLLGPRQTGKTTLVKDITVRKSINLIVPSVRRQLTEDPDRLLREIQSLRKSKSDRPLISIDEIQLVPELLNVAQYLIDENLAQFILTGSSARKIRAQSDLNLLPGRVVYFRLDALTLDEFMPSKLEDELYFGALPGIAQLKKKSEKADDLHSYVETYLEEEIRKETNIRDIGAFSRFLSLAASDAGNIVNFSAIANDCGVSSVTVQSYYKVLEDCLICDRILPFTQSTTRKKLTRSPKFLFFDLGVRRIAANEGESLGSIAEGRMFEQFIGIHLLRLIRSRQSRAELLFWNDPSGPEVDFIIRHRNRMIPIEVKLTKSPKPADAKHIFKFISEYPLANHGYVISQCEETQQLSDDVTAISWRKLSDVIDKLGI
jgi:predicted AAA+ superfamily ATPase